MKIYQTIQPEVITGLGEQTDYLEIEPPFLTVFKLHVELEDWLGDDLIECYPCYIVTEKLKEGIQNTGFSGFDFAEMTITKNKYFDNNYRLKKGLPKFYWLHIIGKQNIDDLVLGNEKTLLIEEKMLTYLRENFILNYMDVNPERNEFDDLLNKMIAESKK